MNDFSAGTLSKVVPARRVTIKFRWCKREFQNFGFHRGVREKHGLSVQRACFWCKTPFKDEDMTALAQPESGKNQLLCQSCAAQIDAK